MALIPKSAPCNRCGKRDKLYRPSRLSVCRDCLCEEEREKYTNEGRANALKKAQRVYSRSPKGKAVKAAAYQRRKAKLALNKRHPDVPLHLRRVLRETLSLQEFPACENCREKLLEGFRCTVIGLSRDLPDCPVFQEAQETGIHPITGKEIEKL